MSLFLSPHPSLISRVSTKFIPISPIPNSIFFSPKIKSKFSTRFSYNFSSNDPDPSSKPGFSSESGSENPSIVDEWGEKTGPEPEPTSKIIGVDPPVNDDEWGGSDDVASGNGSPAVNEGADADAGKDERLSELKRAFVDTVYGSDFGFRASAQVRGEALELVAQLEAANPNSSPAKNPELLDGNWVLVFTAFSELLPLLAAGNIPLVKVEKIIQSIDTSSLTLENSTTLASPTFTVSFGASASFEIQSPSRIQVEFKQGSFKPPEIKSSVDLPDSVNVFGQNISLSSVQQILNPLQNSVARIAQILSGQSPIKVPIFAGQAKSWLLTTYLDKDLRISRGDGGGIFVLVREGSALLDW